MKDSNSAELPLHSNSKHKDDFQELPHVRLTADQKELVKNSLLRGNKLLKKWASFYPPKKLRQFRNAILKGDRNPDSLIPQDKLAEFHVDLPLILTIHKDQIPDLGYRTVEEAAMQNFSYLVKKFVRKWAINGSATGITRQDYFQEAYMQLIETIWQYNRDDIALSTFVWATLRNRMINVTNQQGHMLCPLTNTDLNLVTRYEQAKKVMNGPSTFDGICQEGLTDEDSRHLSTLLLRVLAENQFGGTVTTGGLGALEEDDQSGDDYTGHRVGIDRECEIDLVFQTDHVKEVFRKANLTKLEVELIEASMEGQHGWQNEFAKRYVSKQTKKPVSRMRITQLLDRAKEKVAKVLEREAA